MSLSDSSDSVITDSTDSVEAVDAVFVIGTGSKNNNEELKYALRNLEKNCPFVRDVYISGECPDWVDKSVVKHLKWPDRFSHAKDANIIDKLRHACEHSGIADRILFCSDDQFQTRVCTWDDFEPRYLRQYSVDDRWYEDRKRIWHTRLHKTLERDRDRRIKQNLDPEEVYYYQPHMWMQIDKDSFIEYAKWCDYEHREDTIIASGYFNFINAGGKPNFDHIFISSNQKWPVESTHIAYSDSSFTAAMTYLKKEFPSPSKYENSYKSTSNKTNGRSDEEIIKDLKEKVNSEPAWGSLVPEIEEAEHIRLANVNGWRKVWNDIINRWMSITDKGKLKIPVTSAKSKEAEEVCRLYHEVKERYLSEEQNVTGTDGKHCSKCEERKRKAREEALKKASETRKEVVSSIDVYRKSRGYIGRRYPEVPVDNHFGDSSACIDCAIEHLSDAVAYMSSNALRPDEFETELARGEVRVAAQHLLALNHHEEYNRCIRMLDSIYSEHSLFSVSELKDLLKTVLNRRSRP